MKKAISIILINFLLVGSLLPFGNFGELRKIPLMLEHFEKHQTENPPITFLKFVVIHYAASSQHDEIEHQEALPFHGNSVSSVMYILPFHCCQLKQKTTLIASKITYPQQAKDAYKHLHSFSFFHPPQEITLS